MLANRWFHLRHPEGFPEIMWHSFRAQCRVWRAYVEATIEGWEHLSPGRCGVPKPRYEFGEPELAGDGKMVSLPLGGELSQGAMKIFEGEYPHQLHADFPIWFRLDLELGRHDLLGWVPEPQWQPALDPAKAAALRNSPLFRK